LAFCTFEEHRVSVGLFPWSNRRSFFLLIFSLCVELPFFPFPDSLFFCLVPFRVWGLTVFSSTFCLRSRHLPHEWVPCTQAITLVIALPCYRPTSNYFFRVFSPAPVGFGYHPYDALFAQVWTHMSFARLTLAHPPAPPRSGLSLPTFRPAMTPHPSLFRVLLCPRLLLGSFGFAG